MNNKPKGVIHVYIEELNELSAEGEVLLRGREIKEGKFFPSEGNMAIIACNFIDCINCGGGYEYCEYQYSAISYVIVESIQLIRGMGNIKVKKFLT